jgi:hypothetical protein
VFNNLRFGLFVIFLSLEFVTLVFVGFLSLEFLFYVFVVFVSFEFLSYILVVYMSLLFVHGPLCKKSPFEKIFFKGEGGGFNYNFEKGDLQG